MSKIVEVKVSIIVPTYKRHCSMVGRAINSLLSQTYDNIEIVIVDDNGRDDLKKYRIELERLIDGYGDNRIKYIQNEKNLGGAGARNIGWENASGEFITFLDDDDEYLPEKVEKQLHYMLENDLDVSFTKLCIYNEDDKLIDVRDHSCIEKFDLEYLRRYHLTKQITGTPTFMLRRRVLESVNGFEIVPMGQEFYLMQKILQKDFKIGYFPECHVKAYRTKEEAISTGKNKITGERALYKYKKQYFSILNFKEKQYVRCRHYAVMAVACKRNRKYIAALWYLMVSVLCNPITAVKEALSLMARRRNEK